MEIRGIVAAGALLTDAYAYADDGLTISGWIDLNIERVSSEQGAVQRISSGGLNSSRLMFSASETLGNGWKAFFAYEVQFDASSGDGAATRQSFIGMTGPYGSLTLGRQHTPSYWVAGYADPSWSANYSMVNNMQFFYGPYRESNSINYDTPRMGGVQGRFMYAAGAEDGSRNGRYLSAGIDYRNGPFYAGLVSDLSNTKSLVAGSKTILTARDHYLALTYRFGDLEPTFIYHRYDGYYAYPPYTAFQSKGWDRQIGVRYQVNERNSLFGSHVHRKDAEQADLSDADGMVVGYAYRFTKRTDAYLNYARVIAKRQAAIAYPVTFSSHPAPSSGVQLGLRHGF
ncbi:putative porin [Chromobacterium alkanivorans]|uniref:porin n=1 Tax=Chromobacterium alkanivorans TaxID=1071719 RepID=UPI002168FF59|nr:porin [Chromobacterium alkanivorans]MCS3805705.1 putative porin [Chromobacterium alkanivorans]MCS3820065.1 putative porin [Chromobacterium alkanivorans]MCS3874822.1 putative porin [Chromobacterium alkanivorans]